MPSSAGSSVELEQRTRILSAAERAFSRHGFHRASMQDVAGEARMSVGNLYRYFGSKDALVSGLTARDQAILVEDMKALASSPDLLAAMGRLLRKHLIDEPVWRTQLVVEIWAEAGRNAAIAALCRAIDDEAQQHSSALVAHAQASEPALSGGDPAFAVRLLDTVVSGLFKRRALVRDFDGDAEIALALGAFKAALDGSLQPYETSIR